MTKGKWIWKHFSDDGKELLTQISLPGAALETRAAAFIRLRLCHPTAKDQTGPSGRQSV